MQRCVNPRTNNLLLLTFTLQICALSVLLAVAAVHANPIPYADQQQQSQFAYYAAPQGYAWSLVPVQSSQTGSLFRTNHDQLDAFPTVVEGRRRLSDDDQVNGSVYEAMGALYAPSAAQQGQPQIPYYPGVHTYSWPQPPVMMHHPRAHWPQPAPIPGMVPSYTPNVVPQGPAVPRPAAPGGPRGPPEIETEAETFQPRPDTGMAAQQPPSHRNWDPLVRRVVVC